MYPAEFYDLIIWSIITISRTALAKKIWSVLVESPIKQMDWEKDGIGDLQRGVGTLSQQSRNQGYKQGTHPNEYLLEGKRRCLFIPLGQEAKPRLSSEEVTWWGLFCVLVPFHLVCLAVPSWALKITLVCWVMNSLRIWWKSWPFSPGKCTSAKTHKTVLMISRSVWAIWPPFMVLKSKTL